MRKFSVLIIALFAFFFENCISSPVGGILVTNTSQHISGFESSMNNSIGDGKIEKKGTSCRWGIFPLTFVIYHPKDANLIEALEKGGITKIGVVDRKSLSILSIYYRECVEVWGE